MNNIRIQNISVTCCPIPSWKETDNCLQCRFFGGIHIAPSVQGLNVSLTCNMQ